MLKQICRHELQACLSMNDVKKTLIRTRYFCYNKNAKKTSVHKRKNQKIPAGIYLLKINNDNSKTRCTICSKLTKKTQEQPQ